jgi:hypothetical protein
VFAEKGIVFIPAARPFRSRLPRELLVNNEKFLTGQAAGLSNGVNGMISIKLKTRRKYFKFANLESIFRNDTKKLLYSVSS